MIIPTQPLDPALKALFEPEQKPPDYDEWFRQQEHEEVVSKWITQEHLDAQRDFALRLDVNRRRSKLRKID